MAQLLVRGIEDSVKDELRRRAKRNRRSMEAEVRAILLNAAQEVEKSEYGLGSEIVALFSGQGIGLEEGEEIREFRGMRMQIPEF